MRTDSEKFWFIRPNLILPTAAVLAVLDVERAGHTLKVDKDDLVILIRKGTTLDERLVDALKPWKQHAILFVTHCATDTGRAPDANLGGVGPVPGQSHHGQPS